MNELAVIEKNDKQWVNARDLHKALEVGRDFSTWVKGRIKKYGFLEGVDYQSSQSPNLAIGNVDYQNSQSPNRGTGNSGHTGGSPSVDYALSVGMAKELAMVENNGEPILFSV